MRHTFWLDMHKADEEAIAESIERLKAERTFASTVRDGIRLIVDLRAGRTDVLFTLFPWIRDAMQTAEQGRASEIFEQMVQMQAALDALRSQIAQQPAALAATAPRVNTVTVVEGAAGKASAADVAKNFLSSMQGVAGSWFE